MTEWISVKDRLPELLECVLCCDTQIVYIAYRPTDMDYNEHWIICEQLCCSCNGCTGAITHWAKTPEPPQHN